MVSLCHVYFNNIVDQGMCACFVHLCVCMHRHDCGHMYLCMLWVGDVLIKFEWLIDIVGVCFLWTVRVMLSIVPTAPTGWRSWMFPTPKAYFSVSLFVSLTSETRKKSNPTRSCDCPSNSTLCLARLWRWSCARWSLVTQRRTGIPRYPTVVSCICKLLKGNSSSRNLFFFSLIVVNTIT